MKNCLKILILLPVFCFNSLICFAYTDTEYISLIEKQLFSTQYIKEPLAKRLERVEKQVFGKKNNLSTPSRMLKLKQIFKYKDPVKPVTQVKKTSTPKPSQAKATATKKTKITASSPIKTYNSYPKISELEKTLFSKAFESETIDARLDRLEYNVFKQKTTNPPAQRLEELEKAVRSGSARPQLMVNTENSALQPSNAELSQKILELESSLLGTQYLSEPLETRVERLEMKVFNSTSPEDLLEERVQRIEAVASAETGSQDYRDIPQARQYQNAAQAVSIMGIGLMILQGLLN